jgi:hypothetical protein
MIIPTLAWSPTSITGSMGSYVGWNSTPIDAEAMINDLVDALAPFHLASTVFDLATVFTIANELAPIAIPKTSAPLTQIGTSSSTSVNKAVQNVFTFRTEEAHILKIYLLDSPVIDTNFNRISRGSWNANSIALETVIKADANAWAGRDGAQVSSGIAILATLNEKLRKEYRMT